MLGVSGIFQRQKKQRDPTKIVLHPDLIKILNISTDEFTSLVADSQNWTDLASRVSKLDQYNRPYGRVRKLLQRKVLSLKLDISHFRIIKPKPIPSDDDFREIVRNSKSCLEVFRKLEFTPSGRTRDDFHKRIKNLSISITHFKNPCAKRLYEKKYSVDSMDDETFRTMVSQSQSWTDFARKCGYRYLYPTFRKIWIERAILLGLDTDHFILQKRLVDTMFIKHENNQKPHSNFTLKRRLIEELHWPYECNSCKNVHFVERDGVLMWMDKPISLQLEHKNGINNDDRLENLEFLCALCHTQTSTFCVFNHQRQRAINSWIEDNRIESSSSSV